MVLSLRLSYSDFSFSLCEASLSKPFSIGSAKYLLKLLKLPNILGWTKSNTDHNSERLFYKGVPVRINLCPLTLSATKFLLSSVLIFLVLCPSSTTKTSYLNSLRFMRSLVIIPKLEIRMPPFFLTSLICFSLSDFFLSSNYMILGQL